MDSMIERVANAIEESPELVQLAEGAPGAAWVYRAACRQAARAAIEAMRNPTEAMQRAMWASRVMSHGHAEWTAGIDAALTPEASPLP